MPDEGINEERYLSPDGAEITICRPVLADDEREHREALVRRGMCTLYEAWCKISAPRGDDTEKTKSPFPDETG